MSRRDGNYEKEPPPSPLLVLAAVCGRRCDLSRRVVVRDVDKASLQAVQGLYPNKKTVDVDDGRQSLMVYGNEE
jgi:hypothetical protein